MQRVVRRPLRQGHRLLFATQRESFDSQKVEPACKPCSLLSHAAKSVLFLLLVFSHLVHGFDQAVGPHVGPILFYKIETSGTAVRLMNYSPAVRDVDEAGPEGMLPLFIDQNMIDAVFIFKRIGGHVRSPST